MADTPANREELLDVMQISPHLDKIVIKAILEAIEAAGCVVMPNVATEEMVEAGWDCDREDTGELGLIVKPDVCHAAMTAASPFRPTQEDG